MTAPMPETMISEPHRLDGKLEPETRECSSLTEAATLSIAISLKRIADTIDGTAGGFCISETILGGNYHGR